MRARSSRATREKAPRAAAYTALWWIAGLFILYAGTIPFNFTQTPAAAVAKLWDLSLNPFVSPDTGRRVSIPDVVQNILLFMPFGVLGFMALRSHGAAVWRTLLIVTATGVVLSALVEVVQLFTLDRTTSLSDVVANTAGALVGALCAGAVSYGAVRILRDLRARGLVDVPAFYPLAIATIVIAVAAWQPFDFSLDVGGLVGRVRALQKDPWQFGGVSDEGVELIRYACFGLAAALWLRQLGVRHHIALAAAGGTCVAFGLEASQWIIESRMPGLEDGLVHAGGVLAGTALAAGWRQRRVPVAWIGLLWVATGIAAALQLLSPFELAPTSRPLGWLPFGGYYQRTTFETVSHCFELLLLYFPFAFASGAVGWRPRTAMLTAVIGTMAIAAPLEYLQGRIVGRYGDVTDIALAALGAAFAVWVGGTVWRRIADRTLQPVPMKTSRRR